MSKQSVELLNMSRKNNFESPKITKTQSKVCYDNIENTLEFVGNSNENKHDKTMPNGFEFITRFAYCQALLYKTWVEASDKVTNKIPDMIESGNNAEEIASLHIETYEEAFTNLFKSTEYAANLGKLLNSMMECMKASKYNAGALSNTAYSENNNQEHLNQKEVS